MTGVTFEKRPPPPPPPGGPRRPAGEPGLRALLLLVGGIATAVFLVSGTLQALSVLGRQDIGEAVTFPTGIRKVVVSVDSGRVEIRGHDAATVTGTRHQSIGLGGRPDISEQVEGDTLRITARCGAAMFANWCGTSYELTVPRGVAVDADSTSGRVSVEDVTGDVRARSDAGGVSVDGVSGRVELRTSAGSIEATRVASPSVTASTSAGTVHLGFIAAPRSVTARSSAGSVRVEVPRDGTTYRVEADSTISEADIGIDTSDTSDRVLTLRSSAGEVAVTYVSP